MNHHAFSLVFEYLLVEHKRIVAPLITEFPIDLFEVELTFDEFQTIKAPITGIHLNRFLVPIPKTVKRLSGEGVALNELPPQLETLKLNWSKLNVFAVPISLTTLVLENVTTDLLYFGKIEYIYFNNVEFLQDVNCMSIDARHVILEHMDIVEAEILADKVEMLNISHKEYVINYKINCEVLEFYNVNDINMENVSCVEFQATNSVISCLPKNAKLVDIAESYVGKYEPVNELVSFTHTGEFTVEMGFPPSLKLFRSNNVTMFPKV